MKYTPTYMKKIRLRSLTTFCINACLWTIPLDLNKILYRSMSLVSLPDNNKIWDNNMAVDSSHDFKRKKNYNPPSKKSWVVLVVITKNTNRFQVLSLVMRLYLIPIPSSFFISVVSLNSEIDYHVLLMTYVLNFLDCNVSINIIFFS